MPREERFFVGLRLTRGIQPRAEEWVKYEQPIRRFIDEGLLAREGTAYGSPIAACYFQTKFSRNSSPKI